MSHPAPGALLDALGCVAFECDGSGCFTFLNPAWEQLTGYGVEESLGRPYLEFAAPNSVAHEMEVLADCVAKRQDMVGHEGACIAKDGRRLWLEVHAVFEFDSEGVPVGARGTLIDITSRRELQDGERQRERDAQMLLEASARLQRAESHQDIVDAVAGLVRGRLQLSTTVLYFVDVENGRMALAAVSGTHAEETRQHLSAMPIEDDPGLQEMRRTRAPVIVIDTATLPPRFLKAGLRTMVGVPVWSFDNVLGMLGAGAFEGEPQSITLGPLERELLAGLGVHVGMAASRVDLMAERERQRQRAQALERNSSESRRLESLGLLAGGIAHDFNNVLVGVLGNASLLREALPSEEPLHDAAADICLSAEHAARLAGRLLTYSGGKLIERGAVDLGALIPEAIAIVAAGVPKTTRFVFTPSDAAVVVHGNTVELQQVLMNLLTNASEAAAGGPVTVEITARAETLKAPYLAESFGTELAPGKYAVVEVTDDGHGIDPEVKKNMFDPFVSIHGAGRGFGLASVLGIARAHSGALHVAEREPSGTRFSIVLPLSGDAAPVEDEAPHAVRTRSRSEPRGRGALVVDDEPLVRSFLRRVLQKEGFLVREAVDGEDALAQIEAEVPDLLVLDMSMPKLGGAEVRSAVRRKHRALPIVLASGYSFDDAQLSSDLHTRVLQKPYSMRMLLGTIRDLLSY